jgi:hypothetical protein
MLGLRRGEHPLHVPELVVLKVALIGLSAKSAATSSCSSLSGPMYCPRENVSIASRGPPGPTGEATDIAAAASAAPARPEEVAMMSAVDVQRLA